MNIIDKIEFKLLEYVQNKVTKEYEKNGLTDDVLNAQIRINKLRNKYDISEVIDEFAQ